MQYIVQNPGLTYDFVDALERHGYRIRRSYTMCGNRMRSAYAKMAMRKNARRKI